jgi:uncharacterized protein (TIGR03118 family)
LETLETQLLNLKETFMERKIIKPLPVLLATAFSLLLFSCQKNINGNSSASNNSNGAKDFQPQELKNFVQVNLVADNSSFSPQLINPNLVNARNLAFSPSGVAFVSVENLGASMRFITDGQSAGPSVIIPNGGAGNSHPTGVVFNYSSNFKLPNANPAQVIFITSNGTIYGWNSGSNAVQMFEHVPAASNYGITMANNGVNYYLYAANFAQNKIEVLNASWNFVNMPFSDPNLPAGYAPLNVASISDGKIFVTYAKKSSTGGIEPGNGNGYINVFSPSGVLLQRFASEGKLNAPYGIVKAPAEFWGWPSTIENMILVGNAGDGRINVFDENGDFKGQLAEKGKVIEIEGLSGLAFPAEPIYNFNFLYFTARPGNGAHGIFGYIKSKSFN